MGDCRTTNEAHAQEQHFLRYDKWLGRERRQERQKMKERLPRHRRCWRQHCEKLTHDLFIAVFHTVRHISPIYFSIQCLLSQSATENIYIYTQMLFYHTCWEVVSSSCQPMRWTTSKKSIRATSIVRISLNHNNIYSFSLIILCAHQQNQNKWKETVITENMKGNKGSQ